jgi:hypothetical protein
MKLLSLEKFIETFNPKNKGLNRGYREFLSDANN